MRINRWARCRLWPGLVVGLMLLLLVTQVVSAHAMLLKSEPEDHATLTNPPTQIQMWFSEDVNLDLSSVRVVDENGQEINTTLLAPDPKQPNSVSVSLAKIGPGIYTVVYAILSRMDGHMNEGSILFGVGQSAGRAVTEMETTSGADLDLMAFAGIFFRWLNYITLAFVGGVFAIAFWVLTPSRITPTTDGAIRHLQYQARQRVLAWGVAIAGVAFFAGLGFLGWQIGDLLSSAKPGTAFIEVAGRLLFHSRSGSLWMIRQGLVSLVLVTVSLTYRLDRGYRAASDGLDVFQTVEAKQVRWLIGLGAVLAAGAMVTQSMVSHAATLQSNSGLAVVLDAVHLIAVGCWLGGLVSLRIGLSPLIACEDEDFIRLTRATWSPFSVVAALSVAILFATGIFAMGEQVASLDALLVTPYGLVLLAKMAVFMVVGLFGLLNSMMLHPDAFQPIYRRMGKPSGWTPLALSRMPWVTMAEACTGAMVLFIVGYLVANPTANSPEFRYAGVQQPNPLIQSADSIMVVLSITPNLPGSNLFKVGVSDPSGNPPANISRVILRASYQALAMGIESVDAIQTHPGIYEVKGDAFSLVGPWKVDVVVRRTGFMDTTLHFNWIVPPAGTRQLVSNQDWQPVLMNLGVLILGLVALSSVWLFLRRKGRKPIRGGYMGQ